jgi:hypothetical protein
MTKITYQRGSVDNEGVPTLSETGDRVIEITDTGVQEALSSHSRFYLLVVSIEDGEMVNNGTDTETVTIEVVNGLEVARGAARENATVLDYDGDVTITIDGVETTKTLTHGSVSFGVTTEKPATSTIEAVAEALSDHPAESDSAEIEVTQA